MGSLAFTRKKTSHRTAMVAPLHGALVLLAFVLHLHRNWYLVCCDELLGTCCHVWIFCNHSNEISQVCDSICDLHYACTVDADVGWHVCDDQGSSSSDTWPGMLREQNQLGAWSRYVFQLLRAFLQTVRGQLLLESKRLIETPAKTIRFAGNG